MTGVYNKETTGTPPGLSLSDRFISGINLDQNFMAYVERERKLGQLAEKYKAEIWCSDRQFRHRELYQSIVNFVSRFSAGGYAFSGQIEELTIAFNACKDIDSQVFLADILIGEYIRSGTASEAKSVLDVFSTTQFTDSKHELFYLDKSLGAQYISLERTQHLSPKSWGFEPLFPIFNKLMGGALGVQMGEQANGFYLLNKQPIVSPALARDIAEQLGAPGFYPLFWCLHYCVAVCDEDDLQQISEFEYSLFKLFATPSLRLERQVWNALFIASVQLHKRGAVVLRNKFVKALVGDDPDFWKSDLWHMLNNRINVFDMMLVCFVLFINSIPDLRLMYPFPDKFSLQRLQLSATAGRIAPQRLRTALNLVGKIKMEAMSEEQALRDYLVTDKSLDVYLLSFEEMYRAFNEM